MTAKEVIYRKPRGSHLTKGIISSEYNYRFTEEERES